MMHTIQNTLYVMTPLSYAHLDNATVRIDVEREKKLQVPLHHLRGLVCFVNVMVSPALMHRLADEGKSLRAKPTKQTTPPTSLAPPTIWPLHCAPPPLRSLNLSGSILQYPHPHQLEPPRPPGG